MNTTSVSRLGGHALIEALVAQGVARVYGVPGESYLAALDGFSQFADQIKFVVTRQEGGAAYMAEAEGKLTGRPGVCFVTRGPGATNACIGVHTAFQDSTPMVLLVGDVAQDARDREAFQEVDFVGMFTPLVKRVERIDDAARIPEYVQRAFATALNGRPGPVVLILPEDMLARPTAAPVLPRVEAVRAGANPQDVRAAIALLKKAKKPLVILGGGGWTAAAAGDIRRFAQAWQVPVGCAFRFQDLFDNRDPLYAGDVGLGIGAGLATAVRESDALFVIGARMGEATSGGYTLIPVGTPCPGLVHVHADPEELNRVYSAAVATCAGMPAWAAALAAEAAPATCTWGDWTHTVTDAFRTHGNADAARREMPGDIDMFTVIQAVSQGLPDNVVCTNGAGNFATWLHRFHKLPGFDGGHRHQLAPTNGSMGYGVPAGVAAALASGRPVFTIAGDGDFLMNGQELATATAEGVKTVVLLLNNGMYGTIRMHQEREFPGRVSGSGLRNPDFCLLAQGFGYHAERVTQTAAFAGAWERAWAHPGGALIELMLDPEVITPKLTLQEIREAAQR